MRRTSIFLIVLLLFVTAAAIASETGNPPADTVAHGAEKTSAEQTHGEAGGEGEGHAPKTYFGIPAWVLKLANMLLFIGVLAYFVGGPVKKAFAERTEAIKAAALEARERRTRADQMASEIQARLAQIEAEVAAIHERAQGEGERQKRELIASAEAEAAKILTAAKAEVENRVKHARHELTEYAGQLATDRAERILRERITPADQQKLFQESLREVGGAS